MKPIYLDHSATTPIRTEVLEAMQPYFTDIFGNGPSIHAFGQNAEKGLEDSREKGARLIGAEASEITGVGRLRSTSSLNKKGMAALCYGGGW